MITGQVQDVIFNSDGEFTEIVVLIIDNGDLNLPTSIRALPYTQYSIEVPFVGELVEIVMGLSEISTISYPERTYYYRSVYTPAGRLRGNVHNVVSDDEKNTVEETPGLKIKKGDQIYQSRYGYYSYTGERERKPFTYLTNLYNPTTVRSSVINPYLDSRSSGVVFSSGQQTGIKLPYANKLLSVLVTGESGNATSILFGESLLLLSRKGSISLNSYKNVDIGAARKIRLLSGREVVINSPRVVIGNEESRDLSAGVRYQELSTILSSILDYMYVMSQIHVNTKALGEHISGIKETIVNMKTSKLRVE